MIFEILRSTSQITSRPKFIGLVNER